MKKVPRPFARSVYALGPCTLTRPISEPVADRLGELLAGMDPWLTLGLSPSSLANYLNREDPALYRHIVRVEDSLAGVVCVRYPWLRGPYIELLGLADYYQGQGLGKVLLHWLEAEARSEAKNVWVATSSFNRQALDFYLEQGFKNIGAIEGLIRRDYTELLLRKPLD